MFSEQNNVLLAFDLDGHYPTAIQQSDVKQIISKYETKDGSRGSYIVGELNGILGAKYFFTRHEMGKSPVSIYSESIYDLFYFGMDDLARIYLCEIEELAQKEMME